MTTQALSAAITTVVRAGGRSEDSVAAAEAVRRARLAAPDCVALLHNVVHQRAASTMQRVRSACTLLAVGGLVATDTRASGLQEADAADGVTDEAAAAS